MQRISILMTLAVVGISPSMNASVIVPTYRITSLGTLGSTSSTAYSINNHGAVTGMATTASGQEIAFLHDGFVMTALPLGNGAFMSSGARINESGFVAGTTFFGSRAQATYWNSVDHYLSNFGGTEGSSSGLNNLGQLVGTSQFADGHAEAFFWNGSQMQALGLLPGGDWSSATSINNTGQIVGTATNSTGAFRAFIWTASGGMQQIGSLGGRNSNALDINDAGTVIGSSQIPYGWTHAFRSMGGIIADLGTLGGGNSYAYGLNNVNDVVGYSDNADGLNRAFLFRNGALIDLNAYLLNNSGWTLEQAYDINDQGQIVGVGTYNGMRTAFRLDPLKSTIGPSGSLPVTTPEPATLLAFLAAGGAAIACRSRLKIS